MFKVNNGLYFNTNLIVKFTTYKLVDGTEKYAITLSDGTRHIILDKETFDNLKEASGTVTYSDVIVTDKLSVGNIEDIEVEINNIKDFSDVKDVVGTYDELLAYDTSTLNENDIIEVLSDSTHNDAISMYRWENNEFVFVGSIGPFYTKNQSDERYEFKLPNGDREYLSNLRASMPNVNDTTIALTYSQIKTLKNNNQLIAGRTYRITDYSTVTIDTETRSAGNDFDIILKANSTNSFEPICSAHVRSETNYFEQNYVSQWILWYNFDNDTSLCSWVDNTCKGYIYRMIDEYNNDLPYDFKNIQFKRYKIASTTYNTYSNLIGMYLGNDSPYGYTIDNNDYVYRYTFASSDALNEDLSNKHIETNNYSNNRYVKQVKIGPRLQDTPYRGKLQLNNNVFISGNIICDLVFGNQTHTNTIQVVDDFSYNYFGSMMRKNLIYVSAFNHNNIRECFEDNLIGSGTKPFNWNWLGDHASYNIIQGMKSVWCYGELRYVKADSPNLTFSYVKMEECFHGNNEYSVFITNASESDTADLLYCNFSVLQKLKLDNSKMSNINASYIVDFTVTNRPIHNVNANMITYVDMYFDTNTSSISGWELKNCRGSSSNRLILDFRDTVQVVINNAIKTYDRQIYTVDGSIIGFFGVFSYEVYDSTNNFKTTYVWSSVMDGLTPTINIIAKNLTRHEVVNRVDSNYKIVDNILVNAIDKIDPNKDYTVDEHDDVATYRFTAPLNSKLLMLQSIAGNSNKIAPSTPSDDSVSRLKTIPDNTYKSQIDYIGGMSYKYNQLVQNGNFESASGWNANNGTLSVSNNILTYTQTTASGSNRIYGNELGTKLNHKYLVMARVRYLDSLPNNTIFVGSGGYSGYQFSASLIASLNTWYNLIAIFTRENEGGDDRFSIYPRLPNANDKVEIQYSETIDFTDIFGAGSEPSTVESAIPLLRARGYKLDGTDTYSLPTIRDTKVSEIKANKNLYIVDSVSNGGVLGDYTVSSYSASSSGITISNRGNSEYNRVKLKLDTVVGRSYTFTATASINTRIAIADNVDTLIVNYYNYNGTNSITFTATTTNTYVYFYDYYSTSPVSFTDITVFKDDGDLVKQIPLVVQQLDGYGMGINDTLYNYVDLNAKKFIKKVGKILGSSVMTLYKNAQSESDWLYYFSIAGGNGATASNQILCNKLETKNTAPTGTTTGCSITSNFGGIFYVNLYGLIQTNDIATALAYIQANLEFIYPLPSVVETDISEYIDSDFNKFATNNQYVQVEMVNEHNANLPSKLEYYGTIIHSLATAVKQEGFNVWDEITEAGAIDNITGNNSNVSERIRSKNYIEALPSTIYYFKAPNTYSSCRIVCYDINKNYLGSSLGWLNVNNNSTFTTPSNCYFIRFVIVKTNETYDNDICINISNQDLNGTYKPYKAPITRLLPNSEAKYSWGITDGVRNTRVFCDDECNPVNEGSLDVDKSILKDLNYEYTSSFGMFTTLLSEIGATRSLNHLISNNYIDTGITSQSIDQSYYFGASNIAFKDSRFDNATDFKNHFGNDENLLFEKAKTDTETLDDFDFSFDCEEGDTFTIIGCELLQCYATYSFLIESEEN